MIILEKKVFVVLQVTRGRSEAIAVFNEEQHAKAFIPKLPPGKYVFQETTLYDFEPSEGEI